MNRWSSRTNGGEAERPDPQVVHLAALPGLPCTICGMRETLPVPLQMHSVAMGKGLGAKPHTAWTLPLCEEHRTMRHRLGERPFWRQQSIDPFVVALALWRASPDVDVMERILAEHRA